jgi:hypothetical protein
MGQFRVEIVAVGNHGCQREVKDGGEVTGCGQPGCTDCMTRDFVAALRGGGASIEAATITHWPGTTGQVVDDLVTGRRSGSF